MSRANGPLRLTFRPGSNSLPFVPVTIVPSFKEVLLFFSWKAGLVREEPSPHRSLSRLAVFDKFFCELSLGFAHLDSSAALNCRAEDA